MRSEDEDDEEEYDDDQEDEDVANGHTEQIDDDDDDGDGDADGDVGMDGGGSDDEEDEDEDGDGDDDDEEDDGEGDDDEEDEDDEEGDEEEDEGEGEDEDEDVEMADGEAEGDEEGSVHSSHSKAPSQRNLPPPPHLLRRNLLVPSWTTPPSSLTIDVIVGIPLPAPVHTLANTMCSTLLLAGSQEGYIRVYDFYASVNGGQMMTAQQKTMVGLGESVTKAGVGKGWWPVEVDVGGEKRMEPVYSMACESDGLWVLAGTQSGPIQLYTLRHSPGHLVHSLKGHNNVVSCMTMLPGEKSFVSGSWDGTVKEWDLNTGQTVRSYPTHGAQISALALKPFSHPTTPSPSPSPQRIEVNGESSNGPIVSVNVGSDFFAADRANGEGSNGVPSDQVDGEDTKNGDVAAPDANGDASNEANGTADAEGEEADADGEREASYDPLFDGDADGEADAEGEDVPISEAVTAAATPSAVNGTANRTAGGGLALPGIANGGPAAAGPSRPAAPTRVGAASTIPILSPTVYQSFSDEVVLTASMDGQVTLMDRRMKEANVGRLIPGEKTPPWCMSACWSGDGRQVFAGRRNGTVDIWDVRRSITSSSSSSSSTLPPRLLKTLKTPTESGPVSCVVAFPDGRHIATASQDNIRLWNTLEYFEPEDSMKKRASRPPFKIVAGHHGGTVSSMLVDPTSRFLTTASGDRGWQGESTKVVLIHEVKW